MCAPVNKKKFILTAVIFFIAFGFLVLTAESVFAQEKNYGLDIVAPSSLRKTAEPSEIIGKAIGAVLAFVSVIFFLLTIYGGIIWMTARGNEQQTDKALKTITSASIGLVIVLGSYVLVGFLFKAISGEPTTEPVVEADATLSCFNLDSFPSACEIADVNCEAINTVENCALESVNGQACCDWR